MTPPVQAALELAAQGFPVFPCHADKSPACERGFHDASKDPDTVRALFAGGAPLIGVPTGPASGFDVLDLDPRHGSDAWWAEHGPGLPATRTHRTRSGGLHVLFRHAPGLRSSAGKLAPGCDVRAEGGYVVWWPAAGCEAISAGAAAEWPEGLLTRLHASRQHAAAKDAADLAPPSAAAVVELLARLPNPLEAGRDLYVRVMLGAKGCLDGLEAVGRCTPDEAQAIRDAAVAWAERWEGGTGADEAEKWDRDWATRDAALAGWRSLEEVAGQLVPGYREEQAAAEFAAVPLPELAAPAPANLFFPADCTLDSGRGYVIKRLIAPGDVCALLGQPSAGKSTLAPHLAYAVAQGRPVFGLRTKPGRTLYAAAEDLAGFRQRMHALREEYGDAPDFAGMECGNLRDPAKAAELRATVATWKPALIVLDTLAAAFGGIDENSSAEMGAVVALARALAATGAAVLLIHHPAKHGDGTPRGHSALNGTLDMVLTIAPEDGKDPDTTVHASLLKNRNGTTGLQFAFRKRVIELGQDREGDAITTTLPMELDGDAAAARAPKMPRRQVVALQALRDALAGAGAEMRGGRAVVSDAAWRRVCETRSLTSSDKPDSQTRMFRAAAGALAATGLVMREDGYSWLAEGGGEFPIHSPDKTDNPPLVRLSAPGKAGHLGRTERINPLGLSVSALSGSPKGGKRGVADDHAPPGMAWPVAPPPGQCPELWGMLQ